ncbi:hypothetical protein NPIL_466931 [Nephila pilipes]|uniref:PiggyBac transposable element-derived protein domain-containing protein n=1 Tax=Nephila pilipes TaxID=299642 RepID=A0A8X6N0A8_NEPPI|nr:hypothetical protein NPIL_466931 [Nephila pilipes]
MRVPIALDLTPKLPENKQYDIYFNNIFTSSTLFDKLSENRMGATGTISVNRTENCSLEDIKSVKMKSRGSFAFQNSKNLKMVRWNDYSVGTLASNYYGFEPVAQTKRWSNIDGKKYID